LLAAPPAVTAACAGGVSGAVAFALAGACPPYTASWTQAGGASGGGTTGLAAGDYSFTVTDSRGATVSVAVAVLEGAGPALTPAATAVDCTNSTPGTAAVTVANAGAPYTFLWGDAATDSLRTGLPAGAYVVTVTDAAGCTAAALVEVPSTGGLVVDLDEEAISCPGAADGSLTVTPLNGLAPYSWLWTGGATGPTLGPLGPGIYAGTLTDALGCRLAWILPLDEPDSLAATATVSDATALTAADGVIALETITGGTAPYTVAWSHGAGGTIADSLVAGAYAASITDAQGCQLVLALTVGATSAAGQAAGATGFALYPNPAHTRVDIAGWPAGGSIRAFDATGRSVVVTLDSQGQGRAAFEVASWPAGVYWLRIEGNGRVGLQRLVVLK
jgi:hypothetical protein